MCPVCRQSVLKNFLKQHLLQQFCFIFVEVFPAESFFLNFRELKYMHKYGCQCNRKQTHLNFMSDTLRKGAYKLSDWMWFWNYHAMLISPLRKLLLHITTFTFFGNAAQLNLVILMRYFDRHAGLMDVGFKLVVSV